MITPYQRNTGEDKERILAQKDEIIRDYQRGVKLDVLLERYRMNNVKFLYKYILDDGTRRIHVVPPEVRDAIISAGPLSVRVLAAKFGYSKTTIHRIRTSGFDNTGFDEDDSERLTIGYVDTIWRCPEHGKMSVSPCPICAARGVNREANNSKPASNTKPGKFLTILTAQ